MQLLLLGVSHQSAPVSVRDALAMDGDEALSFLSQLEVGSEPLTELVVVSTCNRTEFYASVTNPQTARHSLLEACQYHLGVPHLGDPDYAFVHHDEAAVRHLFHVAAGIDSLMLGEHQVLGQVREALAIAARAGTSGVLTTRLFHAAAKAGNRARNETRISHGAVSVALAAVRMAGKVLGDLSMQRVLVVGAGETGRLVSRHFAKEHPASLTMINRTFERAHEVAVKLGGTARRFEDLEAAIQGADVIVTATSSPEAIIRKEHLERVTHGRRGRPIVIVDIASPRDVDASVGKLTDVFLYDLDSLKSVVAQNHRAREKEIPRAQKVLERELTHFMEWYRGLQVQPTVRALRTSFEEIAWQEADRHAKHFHQTELEALHRYTRELLNKLLHHPTARIKQVDRSTGEGMAKLAAVQDLFQLASETRPPRRSGSEVAS